MGGREGGREEEEGEREEESMRIKAHTTAYALSYTTVPMHTPQLCRSGL